MHDESWLIVDTGTDGVMHSIIALKIAVRCLRSSKRGEDPTAGRNDIEAVVALSNSMIF